MKCISNTTVKRPYLNSETDFENVEILELHGSSEASKTVYGTCVYIVNHLKSGEKVSSFAFSKTRTAPITGNTIPLLELLSVSILARLMKLEQAATT